MGATQRDSADPYKRNTLGWNSNSKKHGGEKRQVRCFLLDRGFADDLVTMNATIQSFSKSKLVTTLSCKDIVEKHWYDFKDFIDNYVR